MDERLEDLIPEEGEVDLGLDKIPQESSPWQYSKDSEIAYTVFYNSPNYEP